MTTPERRAHQLRRKLQLAAELYYNEGRPPISDAEYDASFDELRALEAAHPEVVTEDSPTQRIGAPLPKGSSFDKVAHLAPMLSIESLTTAAQVREFGARARKQLELDADVDLRWFAEPKLDGVSASLRYDDGRLVRGLSRGDGAVGEDITRNLRAIRGVPLRLAGRGPFPERIEVRGEVIMSRTNFERLRSLAETSADTPFRNARNTVAGTLKLLDPAVVAKRRLDFVTWGVGHVEGLELRRYSELVERLRRYGFQTAERARPCESIDEVIAFHAELEADRDRIEYEMDGIVAKIDDLGQQRRLGRTARTPRWSLAFKFAARRGTTRIERIVAQVGRTGVVTPVAELAPIELAGVTVRRATLHNWGLVAARDVREQDLVEVERAGDVIPAVVEVHEARRTRGSTAVVAPRTCPTCSSTLEAEGAFLYCANVECPDQLRGRIVHLASRRALNIEGLGPKNVDQLIAAELLRRLEDVFHLPEKRDEILALERWGERSFDKLAAAVEAAKRPTLARLLHALGIRHVGEQTAKELAAHFDSLEALREADEKALCEVEGVGSEVAASIHKFFALPENLRFLDEAAAAGLQVVERRATAGPLTGRNFCFTGGLGTLSRDDAKALVEGLGARTSASISSGVTDVVAGQKAGSKLERAKKLGIAILDEDAFLALVGRRAVDAADSSEHSDAGPPA